MYSFVTLFDLKFSLHEVTFTREKSKFLLIRKTLLLTDRSSLLKIQMKFFFIGSPLKLIVWVENLKVYFIVLLLLSFDVRLYKDVQSNLCLFWYLYYEIHKKDLINTWKSLTICELYCFYEGWGRGIKSMS